MESEERRVEVRCRAAYRYPEEPVELLTEEGWWPVETVLKTWRSQGPEAGASTYYHFQVVVGGRELELTYKEDVEEWYARRP